MSGALSRLRDGLEGFLEVVVLVLMAALATVVVVGVGFRKFGEALVWYDEVASILLAWLTYYGASLAALKRAHIGFPTVMALLPDALRVPLFLLGETVVLGFFAVAAWAGGRVLVILEGTALVSLPWVPARVAQSVIPVGAALFIVAQLLSAPEALKRPPAEREGIVLPGEAGHGEVAGGAGRAIDDGGPGDREARP